MIKKDDIVKMAKHIVRRDKGIPDRRIMHPIRDWLFGVGIAVLIFVATTVYAGHTFFVGINEQDVRPNEHSGVIEYRQKAVIEALDLYEKRISTFGMLRSDVSNKPAVEITEEESDSEEEEDGEEDLDETPVLE